MNETRKKHGQAGFSLIEVLIAVTIVVLMGGVVALTVFPELFRAQRDKAAMDIQQLKKATDIFRLRERRIPSESEWREVMINGSKNHPEPYIDESMLDEGEIRDPWGNPYQYKRLGSNDFEILSWGADGAPGGQEDGRDISSKGERSRR